MLTPARSHGRDGSMVRVKTAKPYHHGELREALVMAGRKLMEEKGLRGFTLRECARRASVSHAAPAHHFASIDALLADSQFVDRITWLLPPDNLAARFEVVMDRMRRIAGL